MTSSKQVGLVQTAVGVREAVVREDVGRKHVPIGDVVRDCNVPGVGPRCDVRVQRFDGRTRVVREIRSFDGGVCGE